MYVRIYIYISRLILKNISFPDFPRPNGYSGYNSDKMYVYLHFVDIQNISSPDFLKACAYSEYNGDNMYVQIYSRFQISSDLVDILDVMLTKCMIKSILICRFPQILCIF